MRHLSRCLVGVKWEIYILGFKNPSQILVLISYITVRYKRGEGGAPPYFANPKETLNKSVYSSNKVWLVVFNVPSIVR